MTIKELCSWLKQPKVYSIIIIIGLIASIITIYSFFIKDKETAPVIQGSILTNNQIGDNLVINSQSQERHVNQEVIEAVNKLPKDKKIVIYSINDGEAYQFSKEINDYLISNHWNVSGLFVGMLSPPPKPGVVIDNEKEGIAIIVGSRI